MEQIIKITIYIHAFFGGVALISGLGSILVKKGSVPHKRFGNLFYYGMLISTIISLVVACLPNHENVFLFLIGVFTVYLLLVGKRALQYKPHLKNKVAIIDKVLTGTMLFFAICMIALGIYVLFYGKGGILFIFFGLLSVGNCTTDFRFYSTFKKNKKAWLRNHVGKMMGAFIASVTAFIVAGIKITTLTAWILPGVIGGFYIAYWMRKLKKS